MNLLRKVILKYGDTAMYIGRIYNSEEKNNLNNNIKLWFENSVVINRDIWFAAGNINGLFRYNLDSKEIYLENFFVKENADGVRLFSDICLYNYKLYFIPVHAKRMYIYDIKHNEMQIVEHEEFEKNKFFLVHQYGQYIYIADLRKDIWMVYNILENSFKIEKNLIKTIFGDNVDVSNIGYCGEKEFCYISCLVNKNYCVYNVANNTRTIKEYSKKKEGYKFFNTDGKNIWGTDADERVCCLSVDDDFNSIYANEKVDIPVKYIKNEKVDKYIISYSFQGEQIRVLNLELQKYKNYYIQNGTKDRCNILSRDYYFMQCINEKIYLCVNDTGEFIVIDICKDKKDRFYAEIDIEILRGYYKKNNAILERDIENKLFTVKDFINEILREK